MRFFSRSAETPSQRYLRSAPSVARMEILSAVCMNQIARLPIAAASEWGRPITDIYGLGPAADVVRAVLCRDRSLYASVARSCLRFLDQALEVGSGDWAENLDMAMQSIGMEPGPTLRPDLQADLPADVQERALGLARFALSVFWVVAQPRFEDEDRDRTVYRVLFESPDERIELTAHDVAAWACVIVGRLRVRDVVPESPFLARIQTVPPMDEPGWYPNPYNDGGLERGDAAFQRFWDGQDWTDRVRFREGKSWWEELRPMRITPNN